METLVNEGLLDGIEGYYPYYSQEQQKFALEFAKEHNWFIIDEMQDGKQLSEEDVFNLIKEKIDNIYEV